MIKIDKIFSQKFAWLYIIATLLLIFIFILILENFLQDKLIKKQFLDNKNYYYKQINDCNKSNKCSLWDPFLFTVISWKGISLNKTNENTFRNYFVYKKWFFRIKKIYDNVIPDDKYLKINNIFDDNFGIINCEVEFCPPVFNFLVK